MFGTVSDPHCCLNPDGSQENHLETLKHNPSIWKMQSLVPEKVQNELVTRAEEGGWGGSYLKWTEFPKFSGVQELNLPYKIDKCIRRWPGMGHLEWFWQRNLCAKCRVPHSNKWSVRKVNWGAMYCYQFPWGVPCSFPCGSVIKNHPVNAEDPSSIPGVWRFSWDSKRKPTSFSLPGKFTEERRLAGYSPWDCKESDKTEWLSMQCVPLESISASEEKDSALFGAPSRRRRLWEVISRRKQTTSIRLSPPLLYTKLKGFFKTLCFHDNT